MFESKAMEMGNEIEKNYLNSIIQLIGFFILLFFTIAFQI